MHLTNKPYTYFVQSVLFILFFVHSVSLFGKDSTYKANYYVEPILRIGRVMGYPGNVYLYSPEIRFGKQTLGEKEWEREYHYPHYGIAFRYGSFDNNAFGNKLAVYGYINCSFFDYKRLSLHYQLGFGVAYWFRCYDSILHPESRYIGKHFNAYIDLELGAQYQLSPSFDLIMSADFTHSSNGATKMPNLGVNVISGHAGLRYHISSSRSYIHPIDSVDCFSPQNNIYFFIAPAFRQSKESYGNYFAGTFQIGYMRRFHPKFRYGGGIDIMYSEELRNYLPLEQRSQMKYISQALFASFEVLYNRVVLHVALASYLHRAFDFYEFYYERAGVKLLLGRQYNHFAGISIKAHGGVADYIEWTYGYQFLTWSKKEK